jgi:transposase
LKNPLFFTDSFFGENPERIETMLFLMSLCLLVYNLGQRELRNNLKRAKIGGKNQLGKLTTSPTLRWIFPCFQGIHIFTLNGVAQIVNLTEERNFILNFLPSSCQKYYLISEFI